MKQYIDIINKALNEATFEYDKTKIQPALMTVHEYLSHRNPRGKMHPSDSYNNTIASMNRDHSLHLSREGGIIPAGFARLVIMSNDKSGKDRFSALIDADDSEKIYAFTKDGVMYYDPVSIKKERAIQYMDADFHDMEIQPVKYIDRLYKKSILTNKKSEYPKVLKRIQIDGEYFEIRQGSDQFGDIAAFNEDDMIVGVGQNEWGAALISVADEYKGKGLGQILQKLYTELYPDRESGGFTPAGLNNATKVWEKEVKKFLSAGIYSNLIRKGEISKERVDKILAGLSGKVDYKSFLPSKKVPERQKDYLVYYNGSNSFVLYDKEYLLDQDQKYIYAFLHLELTNDKEIYVYRFEYDSDKDRQVLLYLAIQQMQNEGEKIKQDVPGSDYYKYDDMANLSVDKNGYFVLDKTVFSNTRMLFNKEKQLRRQIDKYNEILYSLLEDAESKWK